MPYRKVRPQWNEKVARNRMIYQYHQSHPQATWGDISQMLEHDFSIVLTPQRVGKIIKREAEKEV